MAVATFTGDLITDAIRSAGSEGDGRTSPDSSMGIWPARTTLAQNGGFEADARFWTVSLGTAQRDNARARFGTYSWKTTVTANGGLRWTDAYIPGGSVASGVYSHAASIWAEGSVIGQLAQMYIFGLGGGAANAIENGIVYSKPLLAGWNDLDVSAKVAETDRTQLQFTVSLPNAVIGDIAWLDGGMPCFSPVPLPYVEIGAALAEYVPASNILANGDFETNTTGWSGILATIAKDSTHAKTGTSALKVTATSTGSVAALNATITGAPLAVVRRTVGAWVYAEAGMVGKTAQLVLDEHGGANLEELVASDSVVLEAGWNYLLATGVIARSDRTDLRIYTYLLGAAINDAVWWDRILAGTDYVVPGVSTVTRTAGRIQTPVSGLSARQGWIAMRIRPGWASSSSALLYRPTLPVMLWDWRDDASNRITLTYDGGYLTMTRVAAGVADTAQTPLSVARGASATIAASWTAGGVAVSVNGGALRYGYTRVMADDIQRADSTNLGTAPTGGETWVGSGVSGVQIVSGRFTPKTAAGNGYACLDLGTAPARIGGIASFDAGTGGSDNVNTTLISSYKDFAISDAVHCLLTRTGWTLQVVQSSVFTGIATGVYATQLAADGTAYPVALAIDGNTATIEAADGQTFSVTDARIGALAGRYCIWEVQRSAPGTTALSSRWDSVYADNFASAGVSGHIPTLTATSADIGSAAGASGHLHGDVLWHLTGRGTLQASDAAALNVVSGDPTDGTLRTHPRLRHLWPASTSAMQQFDATLGFLGNGGLS